MQTAIGIVCVGFGGLGMLAQFVSAVDFESAQRWGLQESDDRTDPLYRRLERNTARWDVLVAWTLPVAGVLMLADHSWWPFVALAAGGVYADSGGREIVKILGLRSEGIRTGTTAEVRVGLAVLGIWTLVGLLAAIYALVEVV